MADNKHVFVLYTAFSTSVDEVNDALKCKDLRHCIYGEVDNGRRDSGGARRRN